MLALFHKMLSGTLSVGSKVRLYRTLAAIFTSENDPILGSYMCRLPFSLVLKTSHSSTMNEAVALRYLSQVPGINAPFCIDCVRTDVGCYLLSTWISGDCFHDVWDALTSQDKEQPEICQQLFEQFQALRKDHSVIGQATRIKCAWSPNGRSSHSLGRPSVLLFLFRLLSSRVARLRLAKEQGYYCVHDTAHDLPS